LNTNNPIALSACSELITLGSSLCQHECPSPEISNRRVLLSAGSSHDVALRKGCGYKDAVASPNSYYCPLMLCRFPATLFFDLKEGLSATTCIILSSGKFNLSSGRGSS